MMKMRTLRRQINIPHHRCYVLRCRMCLYSVTLSHSWQRIGLANQRSRVRFRQMGNPTTTQYVCMSKIVLSFFIVPLVFRARPSKICTPYYENATFPCEVSGYPQPKITWYKNAREITNNDKALRKGNSLIITKPWGKDEGIYQCIASNGLETIHQAASLIVGGWSFMRLINAINTISISSQVI